MSPPTRRETLHLGAAVVAGTAGCGERTDEAPAPPTEPPGPAADRVTGYDSLAVRNPAGERFVRDADRDDDRDGGPILVVDRDGADALRFTAEPDGTGAAREYVDATAFDRESLLVVQETVTACHRLVVDYVARPDGTFEVGFCSAVRDASVDCDTDDRHVVAGFVRLPFGLDAPPADGFSVRMGSSCLASRARTRAGGTTRGS